MQPVSAAAVGTSLLDGFRDGWTFARVGEVRVDFAVTGGRPVFRFPAERKILDRGSPRVAAD
jgi:hypothetical protein